MVATVNQAIAFYNRSGSLEFSAILGVDGNPGFFEEVGAGNFPFDPKCFYDHYDHRFVVVAPEVYGPTEAWITIAVSDDSNPHGVWHKYRTNAVITSGSQTYWWDYPGFGFDQQGYYVTANLFGLNQGGWGGVGYRVFAKQPMLAGQPAEYSTLRDGGAASVQVAQHFGFNIAPFFVSAGNLGSIRIQAIQNPLTSPVLVSTGVAVPSFGSPVGAPTPGGNTLDMIDARIMSVQWRNRQLYACHHISSAGRDFARWYHMDTGVWPAAGVVALVESGNIDAGAGLYSFFPAIASNRLGQVGLVCGSSSSAQRVNVLTTGREPTDPVGTMGTPVQQQISTADVGGRWGDYFDTVVDPIDDTRLWAIGEYQVGGGWATWITSFTIGNPIAPYAILDDAGYVFSGQSRRIDVLANDYHTGGQGLSIPTWDSGTRFGGNVTLSAGTGPGGRDELLYTPPAGYLGQDSFSYVIQDTSGSNAFGSVIVHVADPAQFRAPDNAGDTAAGAAAAYYALNNPSVLPDFSTLTPIVRSVSAEVNYASTGGVFADSGLSDNVGA
ncbi:MAG: Ig-like domain-containing protein, partial [Planctomycetes bacterium]|nr:Ig-like domain-containing protein [Planctomycetota bacterium]